MTAMTLLLPSSPILRRVANRVDSVDDSVRRLMDDMLDTMRVEQGLGLAAPQVGQSVRVIVMECGDDDDAKREVWKMANPEIVHASDETASMEEGCLSIPGYRAKVTRPAEVEVRYLDADGAEQFMHARGLLAACVQHEIDHLDGLLFIDRLSMIKRNIILRKLAKDARFESGKKRSDASTDSVNGDAGFYGAESADAGRTASSGRRVLPTAPPSRAGDAFDPARRT